MTEQLYWQQQPIKLTFSRRKTIALHVKEGNIEVRAPEHTTVAYAQSFIDTKHNWLKKALAEHEKMQQDKVDYSLANHIPFMGFKVHLVRKTAQHPHWKLAKEGLHFFQSQPENATQSKYLLADFYQKQAQYWLKRKTVETSNELGLKDRLSDIGFRKTKTKWGHCTREGRIQYNWQIMMAPENVIDYLVAHEVCHLQHLNHSSQFWDLVGSIHPDYKNNRHWLKENGHRLTLE